VFFAVEAKPTSLRKAIAMRLAEREPVLIVELAVSGVRQPSRWSLRRRVDGIVYRPFHLPERVPLLGGLLRQRNVRRLGDELNRLSPPGERIVCYDSPTQDYLVGKLEESRRVYLAIDDRTITLTGDRIDGELDAETRLLAAVDSVICVSATLAGTLRGRLPARSQASIHVLENGFDERLFDPSRPWAEPTGLSKVSRPRVLVMGHVSERIDWDGIAGCRRLMPAVQWVFVGPADRGMRERVASLDSYYFDPVPNGQVPGWIAHCDACAVPYRLNVFTQASSPIKAFEYLAMGAPTLSTRVDGLRQYESALAIVDESDAASYASALERVFSEGRSAERVTTRRAAVADATIAARVRQFLSKVAA
jgi:glycosyltransferase involved in cell wall biosynthesis